MARVTTTSATDILSVKYFDDNNVNYVGSITQTYTREDTTKDDIVKTTLPVKVFNEFGTRITKRKNKVNFRYKQAKWRPPTNYQSSGYIRGTYFVAASQVSYRAGSPSTLFNCRMLGFNPLNTHNEARLQTVASIGQAKKNQAMITALKRIGDQKWNAGAALAEAREAVGMIATAAQKLAKAMIYARAGQWAKLARHLGVQPVKVRNPKPKPGEKKKPGFSRSKNVANGWLQYHFGWAPIVDDMAQSLIFLSGVDEQTRFDISGHARVKEKTLDTSRGLNGRLYGGYQQWIDYVGKRQVDTTDEYSVHLYYDVTMQSLRELERYGLLGLTTPWALKSMSFLVDWVLPIGDFFKALDATIGATFKAGCTTSFQECTEKKPVFSKLEWGKTFPLKEQSVAVEQSIISKAWVMKRTVLSGPPIPLPLYIKDPLGVWRATTALALFRQFR